MNKTDTETWTDFQTFLSVLIH